MITSSASTITKTMNRIIKTRPTAAHIIPASAIPLFFLLYEIIPKVRPRIPRIKESGHNQAVTIVRVPVTSDVIANPSFPAGWAVICCCGA